MSIVNTLKQRASEYWQQNFDNAVPGIRSPEVAFVYLSRETQNGEKEPVGVFVPELYILASTPKGSLSCQYTEREWNHDESLPEDLQKILFRPDGSRKTPFELAVLPCQDIHKIGKLIQAEYQYRYDRQLPLPAFISKLRARVDYLKYVPKETGLIVERPPKAIRINLLNPVDKASRREKILHFFGPKLALLITVSSAIALAGYAATWAVVGAILGLFIAKYCGNRGDMFDKAESLSRDLGWLFSPEFAWRGKFSLENTLKTLVKLASMFMAIVIAGAVAWHGALSLPWMMLGHNMLVHSLQYTVSGLLAGVAGATSWISLTGSIRYFWNLSFWDNQIEVTKEMVHHLPVAKAHQHGYKPPMLTAYPALLLSKPLLTPVTSGQLFEKTEQSEPEGGELSAPLLATDKGPSLIARWGGLFR